MAPTGIDYGVELTPNRLMADSEMKFAVAHISKRARHLTILCLPSETFTIALANNCGVNVGHIDARLSTFSPIDSYSQSILDDSGCDSLLDLFAVALALFAIAKSSKCKSVLCRFWQIVQL